MPDWYKDEEIENRTQSLCLFDVMGITVQNRCSTCPGATRTPLQHRHCPRELPDSKISTALKSLASSSKQHESGHHGTDTVLPDGFARLSLGSSSKQDESGHHEADTVLPDGLARLSLGDSDGTAETFGRSESGSDIPGGRPELSGTPRRSHGVKRKSELEDREVKLKHLSVQDYLKLKPLPPLVDLEPGNPYVPGCWRVSSYEMTALLTNSSAGSPMDTQEYRASGEAPASRPFVAGFCINSGLGGSGLAACNDGIETEGCERLADLDEMQI